MRAAAALVALCLASPVSAYTAQNGLIVHPTGAHSFTIPWRGKSGPSDFWCAAGDYALRALRLEPSATVYRASEPPRRSGEPMDFTLAASEAASSSGLALHWPGGAGMSAASAQAMCEFRTNRR